MTLARMSSLRRWRCGLPVIVHVSSGGVPELVRTAGVAFNADGEFRRCAGEGHGNAARHVRRHEARPGRVGAIINWMTCSRRYMEAIRGGERRRICRDRP